MLKKLIPFILFLFCLFPVRHCFGFETRGQDCLKCHTLTNDEARELLKGVFQDIKVLDIKVSPAKGVWEVFSEVGRKKGLVYIDFSKKFLFLGSMISIKEKKNLTQERFTELNKVDISQIPLEDALVMGDPKARILVIVFTDPD